MMTDIEESSKYLEENIEVVCEILGGEDEEEEDQYNHNLDHSRR